MIKKTIALHNDFKRTGVDITGNSVFYEIYQDLNAPNIVLIIQLTSVGTATTEKYYLTRVADTTSYDTLWSNRTTLIYKNLIDINIDDKLN